MSTAGLSGNVLPVHLKPLPDELLSSWLVRLAHGHSMKLQAFSSLVFGRNKPIWNRDIDKLAPDWMITKLSEASGVSMELVLNSSLRSYEGILYEQHQPNGNTKWLLPLGIYHRTRRDHGLQYCPHCLAEDAVPYFRKRWRLAFSVVCTKHECYLLNACPQCDSALSPHRVDMHGREYLPQGALHAHCWKCGFALRKATTATVEKYSLVLLQTQLEFAIKHGYVEWCGNPTMHSVVYFEGLRQLIAGITSRLTRERLEIALCMKQWDFSNWPRLQFEMADQSSRCALFELFAVVLENWPINFVDLIRECKLRYADLKGDSEQRMFWYEDVIRREAGGGYAAISTDEADSIAGAVIARFGKFSLGRARRLSGRDIASHLQDRKVRPVSDDVYEELLTSIDHQVAGTLDKTERACLIRDKVMFAAGRQLGLSESDLGGLTLERVRELVPDEVELDFTDIARTPGQARAWVEWYWENIRPQLRPKPKHSNDYLFTSAKTRRRFSRSTVGMRFQRLVGTAMMHRSIHSYEYWK